MVIGLDAELDIGIAMNTDTMKNRQVDGWIDVNKELPSDGQQVNVIRKRRRLQDIQTQTIFNKSKMPYGFYCDAVSAGTVTHWKP